MSRNASVVAGTLVAALLVSGCAAQGGRSDRAGSSGQSTGGTAGTPQPSAATAEPSQRTSTADVTVHDLLTAVSPGCAYESERMVGGQVPGAITAYVRHEPGHPWSPVYLDMAGLGYRQALSVFACGGANFIPNYLMLTGSGGELIGVVSLSDHTDTAHGDVRSMEQVGDSVHVTWVASGAAGKDPVERSGTVRYEDGRLVYTED